MKNKVKLYLSKLKGNQIKNFNFSNWIVALATVAIFVLAVLQYGIAKKQTEIQNTLARIELLPSIELEYHYENKVLYIKNMGRTSLFYHTGTINTFGEKPELPILKPKGKRIIAINSQFPMKFDVEVNRAIFKIGEKNEFNLYGQFIISNLDNEIYDVRFVVKAGLTFTNELTNQAIVNYQGAWIEEMNELSDFPWITQ